MHSCETAFGAKQHGVPGTVPTWLISTCPEGTRRLTHDARTEALYLLEIADAYEALGNHVYRVTEALRITDSLFNLALAA